MKPPFYKWLQARCLTADKRFIPLMVALSYDVNIRGTARLAEASVDDLRGHLAGDPLELRFMFEDAVLEYEGGPDV